MINLGMILRIEVHMVTSVVELVNYATSVMQFSTLSE